mgnify:CR=1 FL=1
MLLSLSKKTAVLIVFIALTSFTQNSCDLAVKVTDLRNSNGHFLVSLWDKSTGFPDDQFTKELIYKELKSPSFSFSIKGLPYGDYALAALHDENKDGEMEFNWVGMPKEGFAFSRNYNVTIRAPKWEESVIKLNSPVKEIEMKMQY